MDSDEQIAALRAKLIPEPERDAITNLLAQIAMLEHANDLLAHALKAVRFENTGLYAKIELLRGEREGGQEQPGQKS